MNEGKSRGPIDESSLRAQVDERVKYIEAQLSEKDRIIKGLKSEIGSLKYFEGQLINAIKPFPKAQLKGMETPKPSRGTIHEAMLDLTDIHAEELVKSEEMEGYAHHDWESFLAKAWLTGEKTLELVSLMRANYPVPILNINLLGDILTGVIHDELDRTNTFQTPDAVVQTASVLAQLLLKIAPHFDEIPVRAVVGNHGRMDKKPPSKQKAARNWDYAVYQITKLLTRSEPKIKWTIPESPAMQFDCCGKTFLIKHGDSMRSTGILPYYGIYRDSTEEQKKRKPTGGFDYMKIGHWHHFARLEGNVIISPSMIGPSQYSFNKLHTTSPAAQLLTFITAKHDLGIVDYKPIKLDKANGHKFEGLI